MQASVTQWLDATAQRLPNKAAITDEQESVTFRDFRDRSLAIARTIIAAGIGMQKPVAIYLEKSARVLVSFMGVAYSRNYYSPIDTEMPQSRVDKIFEVLQPELIITSRNLLSRVSDLEFHGKVLVYEDMLPDSGDEAIVTPVSRQITCTDLLYVLFTSGSTGIPKGAALQHCSMINSTDWFADQFGIMEQDVIGNQAPFYFAVSTMDVFCMMKMGASLHIIPKKLFSQPVFLLEYLNEHHISFITWVPSALLVVARLRALKNVDISGTLRQVVFAGEAMPMKTLNYWRTNLPNVRYANCYGSTEMGCHSMYYVVDRSFDDSERLPLGHPAGNTTALLIDEDGHQISPEQVGTCGLLYIKTPSLAVSYYKDPEKTRAAFVQNPLHNNYDEKLYCTGDLACYNEFGELVYMGRKDYQIKHMGHRIELGEIEAAVSALDDVPRCCCLYDDKTSRIVLVIESDHEISRMEFNNRLKAKLPDYMLPNKIITMPVMPLNISGKLDRKKLKDML